MLIERDHELARIIERTQTLRAGGVCLLLHGESGIGKTSLLRAAISRLPPGIDWLWSSCEPVMSAPPLGALVDLIDRLLPSLAAVVRSGRATLDVLVGMLSLLRDRVRDLTAGKLTPKLSDRIADVRGRQHPILSCLMSFRIERQTAAADSGATGCN